MLGSFDTTPAAYTESWEGFSCLLYHQQHHHHTTDSSNEYIAITAAHINPLPAVPRAREPREAPAEEPHRERAETCDQHVQPEVELFPSDKVRVFHVSLSNVRLGLGKKKKKKPGGISRISGRKGASFTIYTRARLGFNRVGLWERGGKSLSAAEVGLGGRGEAIYRKLHKIAHPLGRCSNADFSTTGGSM